MFIIVEKSEASVVHKIFSQATDYLHVFRMKDSIFTFVLLIFLQDLRRYTAVLNLSCVVPGGMTDISMLRLSKVACSAGKGEHPALPVPVGHTSLCA